MEEQPTAATLPTPVPKQSPRPKKQHPLLHPVESMPLDRTTLKATLGGPTSPIGAGNPSLVKSTQAQPCQGI